MKSAIKILNLEEKIDLEEPNTIIKRADQGFLTSNLRFLNRKEAFIFAKSNGQFKRNELLEQNGLKPCDLEELFSEDLW